MKLISRILLAILTAGLGFGLGTHVVSLHADRENGLDQARELHTRLDRLLAEQKKLRDEGTRLNAALTAANARVTAAEKRYTEERATNEPLRRQVEQMMGRQIANTATLDKHVGDLKTAQQALAAANERAAKLVADSEALKNTIQGLQGSLRDKTDALNDQQAKLAAAQAQVTALEKTQAETQAKAAAAEAALADANKKNAELAAALDALRKPDAAAHPAPAPGR